MNVTLKDKLIHNAQPSLFDIPNPPSAVTLKRPLPKRNKQPTKQPKRMKKSTSTVALADVLCDNEQVAYHPYGVHLLIL